MRVPQTRFRVKHLVQQTEVSEIEVSMHQSATTETALHCKAKLTPPLLEILNVFKDLFSRRIQGRIFSSNFPSVALLFLHSLSNFCIRTGYILIQRRDVALG